jgi:hypothetical protein
MWTIIKIGMKWHGMVKQRYLTGKEDDVPHFQKTPNVLPNIIPWWKRRQYSAFTHLSYRSNCNIYLVLGELSIVCHLWSWHQFVLIHSTKHPYTILLNLSRCSQHTTHCLLFTVLFHHTWTLQATSKHILNSLWARSHYFHACHLSRMV